MERHDLSPYIDRFEEVQRTVFRYFQARTEGANCISPSQYFLLRVLETEGVLTVSDLAERLDMTVAGATGLIDRLVRAGQVNRQRNEEDRRVVHVALTPKGQESLTSAREVRRGLLSDFLSPLSEAEVEQLVSLYEKALRSLPEAVRMEKE